MNAKELADELDCLDWDRNPLALQNIKKLTATMLRQQQEKIDNLYENNARLDAEIEVLKEVINDALKSVPAMGEDGEFYHEHHGMDGEHLGFENIPANYVVQEIVEILRKAQEK